MKSIEKNMEITKDTRVSDILDEHGDIADVMEVFGVKRVSEYSVRRLLTKALTVERAARVHRVPLDEFLATLQQAAATNQAG
ncbi:MAG: DUF1858 domain-containing protein [Anaerolineales bacterium]|nr:DUF1858 domain-containing protein [Anaerolineales bacterium]